MVSYLQVLGKTAYQLLPQNESAQRVAEIEDEISELTQALNNPANAMFKEVLIERQAQLIFERQHCEKRLVHLNGHFYQDPESALKQTWDNAVKKSEAALGSQLQSREQLAPASKDLENSPNHGEKEVISATIAINKYTRLEQKRNQIEKRLKEIVATEKSGPLGAAFQASLLEEKNHLLQRQKELCGSHYQDPNGLLHKAWNASQQAAKLSKADAPALLETYNKLETERKHNDARLYTLDQYISVMASLDRSIGALTKGAIAERLKVLESEKADEEPDAGIDWYGTAKAAGEVFVGFAVHNNDRLLHL